MRDSYDLVIIGGGIIGTSILWNRAADLADYHVQRLLGGESGDTLLDLVGDVGNHLDSASQKETLAFLGKDTPVDLSCGVVVVARQVFVYESLVVPQVKVGLGTVLGYEHLPVLIWVHGARINVDVRIELLEGYPETPAL